MRLSLPVCICVMLSLSVCAQDTAIENGAQYLKATQNADGSWSADKRKLVDTIESCKALLIVKKELGSVTSALPVVAGFEQTQNDVIARKLYVLSNSTANTAELLSTLLANQNADGGWGVAHGKQSTVDDTLLVTDALLRADINNTTVLSKVRDYLIATQTGTGAWLQAQEETTSAIARTALGLLSLKALERKGAGSAASIAAALSATAYLETRAQGTSYGTIADTAYVYMAFLTVKQPSQLQGTSTYILNAQQANGSWENDVYTTAVVLQALHASLTPEQPDRPDLLVTEAAIVFNPTTPAYAQPVSITITVFNQGTLEATNVLVEAFNGDPRIAGVAVAPGQTIPVIAAGASAQTTFQFATENLGGPQLIVAFADRANTIVESDETNNDAPRVLTLTGKADLSLAAADLFASTPTPQSPTQVTLTAIVRNIGTANASPVVVRFTEGATQLGEVTLPAIGATNTGTANLQITLSDGAHTVTVQVDPQGAVDELREDNNQASISFNVQAEARADLHIDAADISFSELAPIPGETIQIMALIRNAGTLSSGNYQVLVSQGDPSVAGALQIQTLSMADLPASETTVVTVSYTMPAGTQQIFVTLDSSSGVTETSESNNQASRTITTAPVADLSVSPDFILLSHTNLDQNANVAATVTVENIGTLAATNVRVQFGLDGILVGEQTIPEILALSSAQLSFVFQPPPGSHAIAVIVDPDDQIRESLQSNNSASRQQTFVRSNPSINLFLKLPNARVPSTVFNAFETVLIEVVNPIIGEDIFTYVYLTNDANQTFEADAHRIGEVIEKDVYQFLTLANRAGQYTVMAEVRRSLTPTTYETIATTSTTFTLNPVVQIRAITLYATPSSFASGARVLPVFVQISNGSNIDGQISVAYEIKRPNGQTVTQGLLNHTLPAAKALDVVKLADVEDAFSEAGIYKIFATVSHNNTALISDQGTFQVEGNISLNITKNIEPKKLPPNGIGTVRVDIEIESVSQ